MVSLKATLQSQFDVNLYFYTPNLPPFHHTFSQTANTDFYPMPFTPHIILGAHRVNQPPPMFPGGFREIAFISTYLSPAQLTQDFNRAFRLPNTLLLLYFPEGPQEG